MKTALNSLFFRKSSPKRRSETRRSQLRVEGLEDRTVMSFANVTGGSILPNVEITPIFYGSGWHANGQTSSDSSYFTSTLRDLVNSPFMDTLTNAGYGVGRGSSGNAVFTSDTLSEPDTLDPTQIMSDSHTQSTLQWWIDNDGKFANLQPDSNRLYVIFVEPNVEVADNTGTTSASWTKEPAAATHIFAYHFSFGGHDASGNDVNIRYAVIPYLDGVNNGKLGFASTRDTMTEAASHEIAEAITDPDNSAFMDESFSPAPEVGDVVANEIVYQHGYAVQRIADKNDQPMTPSDAVSQRDVDFVLESTTRNLSGTLYGAKLVTTNELYEQVVGGPLVPVVGSDGKPVTNVRSISDQTIDNRGQAMIDVVMNDGIAWEYHDDGTWLILTGNAKDAKSGQGVSYVLFNNGTVREWVDGDPLGGSIDSPRWVPIDTGVTSIDAGTNSRGVNMLAEVWSGQAWEKPDGDAWRQIGSAVQVSAGRNGSVGLIDAGGNAFYWNEASPVLHPLGSNASKIALGYGVDGSDDIDVLFKNSTLWDWRYGAQNAQQLDYNVRSMSKAQSGVVYTVSNAGNAWADYAWGSWFELFNATSGPLGSTQAIQVA
jgi:hypothetical protein